MSSNAQKDVKLDSLQKLLSQSKKLDVQAKLHYKIGKRLNKNNSADKAQLHFTKAADLWDILHKPEKAGRAYKNIALIHEEHGNFQQALKCNTIALEKGKKAHDTLIVKQVYNNIGIIFARQGGYVKAAEFLHKSLTIEEDAEPSIGLADSYSNLGNIYGLQQNPNEAIKFYKKALKLYQKYEDKDGVISVYSNIGYTLKDQNRLDAAMRYHQQALTMRLELNNKSEIAKSYYAIGLILELQNQIDVALTYFLNAIKLNKEEADEIFSAENFICMAKIYFQKRKNKEALSYALKAYDISKLTGETSLCKRCSEFLAEYHYKVKNFKDAYKYNMEYKAYSDSLLDTEKIQKVVELGFEHEFDRLNKEKELQRLRLQQQEAQNKEQQTILSAFVGGFIIILISAVFILRLFIQKNKAHRLLTSQHAQIRQKSEEIKAQNDEIQAKNDRIQVQHGKITSSINYAEKIQRSLLPSNEYLKKLFPEHFVLFKPRDIVSGDFYWVNQLGKKVVVTAADCTGHGVPGAFMSIMGVSFLNEIAPKSDQLKAGQILDLLRKKLIYTLHKDGMKEEQKDGMDMALCIIDTETRELEYAGAFNPMYLVRNTDKNDSTTSFSKKHQSANGKHGLFEFKADRQPIAVYVKEAPFTTHKIQLEAGDMIYMFSDGYTDQLGGHTHTKLLKKRLREYLLTNASKNMQEQKVILEEKLQEWIGINKQVDDILVMGIKV